MTRNKPMLDVLLERGDEVSLESGRLIIQPKSGKEIPDSWLNKHKMEILVRISELSDTNLFLYQSHKVGLFGSHRCGGVHMSFLELPVSEIRFAIFNVDLKRARSTKNGKQGDPLPNGRFNPPANGAFMNFWYSTGLAVPPSLTSICEYMGNLKWLAFCTESINSQGKIQSSTTRASTLGSSVLRASLEAAETNKAQTASPYVSNNSQIFPTNNELDKSYAKQSDRERSGACRFDYEERKQDRELVSKEYYNSIKDIPPQDQTVDEWLACYAYRDEQLRIKH